MSLQKYTPSTKNVQYFNIIGNYCSNFVNMSDLNKLKHILNPNPDLSSDIYIFIKQSLELR